MKKTILVTALLFVASIFATHSKVYKEDWADLDTYPQAEWLADLKFGMYWHWGMNTIAGRDGWYGRYMYGKKENAIRKYHESKFGPIEEYGYKDFNKEFTAKGFSAKQWVDDARNIGARFIVGMACHHDGFSMYDDPHTPWNSVDMNPHVDVIGELSKEAHKQGMKFGVTSHLAYNWVFFSHFMYNNPEAKADAEAAPQLYSLHDPKGAPSPAFVKQWYDRTKVLVDNYNLDFLWFDFGTRYPEFFEYTKKITADLFNYGERENKPVALANKGGFFNENSTVYDIENGKFSFIREKMWMSDCTYNDGWFKLGVKENPYFMAGEYWLYQLIDVVSKNGTLLLNLGPNADGSWDPEWKAELMKIGDWLKVNGEAIYGTKHWHRYGEGPTHDGDSYTHVMGQNLTSNDVRFTRNGDTLYAIVCGWNEDPFVIKSFAADDLKGVKISSVELIGSPSKVSWKQREDGLSVKFPKHKFGEYAYVLKIKGENLFPERREYEEIMLNFGDREKFIADIQEVRIVAKGEQKRLAFAELYVCGVKANSNKIHNYAMSGTPINSKLEPNLSAALAFDNNLNGNPIVGSVVRTAVSNDPYVGVKLEFPISLTDMFLYAQMGGTEELIRSAWVQCYDKTGKLIIDKPIKEYLVK